MDNYATLLQQFHIKQQQQSTSHQQFAQIIDYIRNEKQSKQSLICRKKQQKVKLMHKIAKHHETSSASIPRTGAIIDGHDKAYSLQQIKNIVLHKEFQQLEKEVITVRKIVKQMQNQLAVFTRKDNEIKQLRYSSRRQLETAELQVSNQKNFILQMQQKYQRLLQQLNLQKINLQHENRFLANQLKQMNSITKNFKTTVFPDSYLNSPLPNQYLKIEELYTKKKLQEVLRSFYIIFLVKRNWNKQHVNKKLSQVKQQTFKQLYPQTYFCFYSKKQIVLYYLQKFGFESLKSLSMMVIELHRNITKNLQKLQKRCNNLNNKLIQLKVQHQRLTKVSKSLQVDTQRSTLILIAEIDNELIMQKKQIKIKSRSIFQIIQKQFKLVDKLKRVTQTLYNLLDLNPNNNKQSFIHSLSGYPFNKKLQNILNQKDKKEHSHALSGSIINQSTNASKNNFVGTNKCLNIRKKYSSSSYQQSKSIFAKNQYELSQFQNILCRNPIQTLMEWFITVKNGRDGANLLQTILNNDLFRLFCEPYDYQDTLCQIQNQKICMKKVNQSTKKLIQSLKRSIVSIINNMIHRCQQLKQKTMKTTNQSQINSKINKNCLSQTRYVIQSKGYFRRDDFRLLEKLEKMQLKKQGLFIPYRYGIDVDDEMNICERSTIKLKQAKLQQKNHKLLLRKPRCTAPDGSNYISSYRQRLNRADRKIRDLLKNADNLRVKNKVQLSGGKWKKNTQSSVLI